MTSLLSTRDQGGGRAALIALAALSIDQATKFGVTLSTAGQRHGLLVPIRNARFSLGLAGASTPVELLVMGVGIALVTAFGIRAVRRGRLPAWALGLVVGGALSNFTDRLVLGSVRDFLAIGHLAVNLADLAVLTGLLSFALAHLSHRPATPVLGKEVLP